MRTFRSSSNTSADATKEANAKAAAPEQKNGYQWTALSVTTVGALLGAIQGSALLIALPSILAELQATFFTIMWVLLGYLLVVTVLTPIIGRFADMWGRKRLYNSGFIFFAIGSLIAGLAQPQFHGADLIAGRVIQGIGAALLITNSTILVSQYQAV
jgi:MFS family permease